MENSHRRKMPGWLEKAVFYEIYPQTFYDSNGDGIGDIQGIIQKLDYVQSLGSNAIWLNPCFVSPFGDAGYDVADFYQVAPRYGTNDDLKELFQEAQKRDMHIILDLVAGHTSIEHPWFKASCRDERNEYTDWYVWNENIWEQAQPDLPLVRGLAERSAGYVPNFFYFQPALNYGFANPDPNLPWQQSVDAPGPQAVRRELQNIMKFWLDMGASGFRVDMAASLIKRDYGHRKTIELWQEMSGWVEQSYPDACLISEWSTPTEALPAGFHMDFYIHFNVEGYTSLFRKQHSRSRYSFSFFDRDGHGNIREFVDEYYALYSKTADQGFISIPSGNHDIAPRLGKSRGPQDLKVAFTFLMTMPGVPYIYYGDEIGMRGVEGLSSKEGGYARTESRTPMQWDSARNAGFSKADPAQLYLPVENDPEWRTVAGQEHDAQSLLNTVRKLVDLRKQHPALSASGKFMPVYAEPGRYPFVYLREAQNERILVVVNPCDRAVEVELGGADSSGEIERLFGLENGLQVRDGKLFVNMEAVSAGIYRI
jgi:glycosidase